jgi:hypothetical protein
MAAYEPGVGLNFGAIFRSRVSQYNLVHTSFVAFPQVAAPQTGVVKIRRDYSPAGVP